MRSTLLFGALCALGCSSEAFDVRHEAVLASSGASAALFLPDGDVAVASTTRGQVDRFTPGDEGYELVGSFFAGGIPVSLAAVRVGGGLGVLTQLEDDQVHLLAPDAVGPHRLLFPVRVHREPILNAIATGDLDGDLDDDLVVAGRSGVSAIMDLAIAIGANPESAPHHEPLVLDPAFPAVSVAALDLDGDGLLEVVAVSGDEPVARIYGTDTLRAAARGEVLPPPVELVLPAPALAVHTTACPEAPLVVLLVGGASATIGPFGPVEAAPGLGIAASLTADADAIVVVPATPGDLTLFDSCGHDSQPLDLSPDDVASLALSPDRLAAVAADGSGVELLRLSR